MPLRIFEARPDRVQIGNTGTATFDTDRQYMYKTSTSPISFPSDPTIQIIGNRLTYRFGTVIYNLNAAILFNVAVHKLNIG